MSRFLVMVIFTVGSIIGSYIPTFFGASLLSFASVLGSAIGGILAIYIYYRLTADEWFT